MGFIGNVVSGISNAVKAVSSAAQGVGKVATAAAGALNEAKGLFASIKSGFESITKGPGGLLGGLGGLLGGFPGIKDLASKLLGSLGGGIGGMLGGLLNPGEMIKNLTGIIGQVTSPNVPGLGQVNVPSILQGRPPVATAPAPATGSSGGASAPTAATGGSSPFFDSIRQLSSGKTTGAELAAKAGQDYSDPDVKKQMDMMAFQKNQQAMQELFSQMSTFFSNQHSTSKSIIENSRT